MIDELLAQREQKYGKYKDVSKKAIELITILNTDHMPSPAAFAIMNICGKLARISNGDCSYKDSWDDIAGYALLVSKEINNNGIEVDKQSDQRAQRTIA